MFRRLPVYLLFFFSGVAGLLYQVVWVRQFGNVFGNTVYSASLVTATFMFGLGLGGFLAGVWGDRRYRGGTRSLLRAYGILEVGIGLVALVIAVVLPMLEPISSLASVYRPGENGWLELSIGAGIVRYGVAILLLLPVTTLMGGTLTLLIRHLVRQDLSVAGLRVGALYGINTAGAALGAFLVDFALVPNIGLFATQSLAVVINLTVGVAALRWAARPEEEPVAAESPEDAQQKVGSGQGGGRGLVIATGLAIMLSGFAAMGLEILWFRYLTTILGTRRATFSLLLTVILLGIWAGSVLGGALHRRFGRAALFYILSQALLVVTALASLYFYDLTVLPKGGLLPAILATDGLWRAVLEVWAQVRIILFLVGLPALCMGLAFPLANANIQRVEASVGTRAGLLYLANTVGAVVGSLITGFLLLPWLGMQDTIVVLAACAACAGLPLLATVLFPSTGSWRGRLLAATPGAIALGIALVAVVGWTLLPDYHLAARTYVPSGEGEKLVTLSEGINESIVITEVPETGARRLYTNGYSMSTTRYSAQRYMRAFVHLPLLLQEAPERVLVICFGVGNTLQAATLHPSVKRAEAVDLSRHVMEHARFFRRWNLDVVNHPKAILHVNDGRQHLRMQPESSYDLVTLEPPPLVEAGVASLYSTEFYELVHSRLKPGGYISQWLPAYQVPEDVARSIVKAFLEVFPDGLLLSGYRNEFILLGARSGPPQFHPEDVARRLATRPEVEADLARIDLGSLVEMAGTIAGSNAALVAATKDVLPVTDDLPVMEYSSLSFTRSILPADLFDAPLAASSWCPTCYDSNGRPKPAMAGLDIYLELLQGVYIHPEFRANLRPRGQYHLPDRVAGESPLEVVAKSGYLQRLFVPRAEAP
jgi:spermidine synthase